MEGCDASSLRAVAARSTDARCRICRGGIGAFSSVALRGGPNQAKLFYKICMLLCQSPLNLELVHGLLACDASNSMLIDCHLRVPAVFRLGEPDTGPACCRDLHAFVSATSQPQDRVADSWGVRQ